MILVLSLLAVATASCNFATLKEGTECTETWGNIKHTLHPTQEAVGYAWVQRKLGKDFTSAKTAQKTMAESATPIVLGPGNIPYLIDDHHTISALNLSGYSETVLTLHLVCNYASLSMADFYSSMLKANFMYGLGRPSDQENTLPVPIDPATIPTTIPNLTNDPWRALAGFSRKIRSDSCPSSSKYCLRAFDRVCDSNGRGISFFEFRWAYFVNLAYVNNTLWDSSADADAFNAAFASLPQNPTTADVDQWQSAADMLLSLCRGRSAGEYTMPASLGAPLANTNLPGYVAGVTTQIDHNDAECLPAVCPTRN